MSLEEDDIKKDMEGLNIFESSINNAVQKEEMESIDYGQDNEGSKIIIKESKIKCRNHQSKKPKNNNSNFATSPCLNSMVVS